MKVHNESFAVNLFEEQLQNRIKHDRQLFSRTLEHAGKSVMGLHLTDEDDMGRDSMREAVSFTLLSFGIQFQETPDDITDFEDLMDYSFHPHGIMRRQMRLVGKWDRKAAGNYIAIDERTGLAVALLPYPVGGYYYYEPFTHKRIKVNLGNRKYFKKAWQITRPLPQKHLGFKDLLVYLAGALSPADILLALLAVSMLSMGQFGLLNTYRDYYEDVFYFPTRTVYYVIFLLSMVTLVAAIEFSHEVRDRLCGRIWLKCSADLESALMARTMLSPVEDLRSFSSGDLSLRISASRVMVMNLTELIFGILVFLTEIYFYMTFVKVYCFEVKGLCWAVIILCFALSLLSALRKIRISREERALYSREYTVAWGIISSIQKLKISGALKRAYSKWGEIFARRSRVLYNPPFLLKIRSVLVYSLGILGIYMGYVRYCDYTAGLLGFVSFMLVFPMILASLEGMEKQMIKLSSVVIAYEMIKDLLNISPEMQANRRPVENIRGSIRLRNVSFAYSPKDGEILKNFNLAVSSGEYVAIVGPTGCGKSTLIRLILGFERPQKGVIHFDEKDLDTMDLRSVRSKIGCVLQESRLFMGTVMFNLSICNPSLTEEQAWDALEKAGVAEDIRQMPMGIHTLISEGSGGISGGQRQRILLARAIAMEPRILILDEATSALDNLSQKKVTEALRNLPCTKIVIAHRISTVMECDRIVVLEKGRIVDSGTYEELKTREGLFREFVRNSIA